MPVYNVANMRNLDRSVFRRRYLNEEMVLDMHD